VNVSFGFRADVMFGTKIIKPAGPVVMYDAADTGPSWRGVPVSFSHLCERSRVSFDIEHNPRRRRRRYTDRRRRRRYTVRRREWKEPCAYRLANGSIVMHPALWAQISSGVHP
jgi:hypothetical protein